MTDTDETTAPDTENGTAPEAASGAAPEPPEDQLADLANRYARLAADFDNFRKRTARETVERSRHAGEAAARALLPVLDNLGRAVEAAPPDTAAELLDGLRHTVRQFEEALASIGVTPIEALGAPFDTALHEAVLGEESPEVEVDTVVGELQRGYRVGDRVLRPTLVKVAHPVRAEAPGGPTAAGPAGDGWVQA